MRKKFRCHYRIDDYMNSFVLEVEGETTEEIQKIIVDEMFKRGLDLHENDCWSKEI